MKSPLRARLSARLAAMQEKYTAEIRELQDQLARAEKARNIAENAHAAAEAQFEMGLKQERQKFEERLKVYAADYAVGLRANAENYARNLKAMKERIDALDEQLEAS